MRNVICRFGKFRKTVFRCMGRAVIPLFGYSVISLMLTSCGEDDKSSNPYDKPHNPNQAVEVRSVSPVSGGIGTKVIVAGSNFGNDTTGVELYFNRKKALIMNIQDNAIYALVPFQPGEFSTIKVVLKGKEATLDGMQFQYFTRTTVTTISGQQGVNTSVDGPALQATWGRPVSAAVKKDGSLLFIVDDMNGGSNAKVKMLATTDKMVVTVMDQLRRPWTMAFNPSETMLFVGEREESARPILFHALSEKSNWLERVTYYDQRDENGIYIAGNMPYSSVAADDTYVYVFSGKLIRVHQITKKIEVISDVLLTEQWNYVLFNAVNKKLYIVCSGQARIYEMDPYHTPEGMTTPWLTVDDMKWVVGSGRGSTIQGNGRSMRFGGTETCTIDVYGNIYLADSPYDVVWKVDMDFNATVIGGISGSYGYRDGDPKEALFNSPFAAAATNDGRIYVCDGGNYLIRLISIQ